MRNTLRIRQHRSLGLPSVGPSSRARLRSHRCPNTRPHFNAQCRHYGCGRNLVPYSSNGSVASSTFAFPWFSSIPKSKHLTHGLPLNVDSRVPNGGPFLFSLTLKKRSPPSRFPGGPPPPPRRDYVPLGSKRLSRAGRNQRPGKIKATLTGCFYSSPAFCSSPGRSLIKLCRTPPLAASPCGRSWPIDAPVGRWQVIRGGAVDPAGPSSDLPPNRPRRSQRPRQGCDLKVAESIKSATSSPPPPGCGVPQPGGNPRSNSRNQTPHHRPPASCRGGRWCFTNRVHFGPPARPHGTLPAY